MSGLPSARRGMAAAFWPVIAGDQTVTSDNAPSAATSILLISTLLQPPARIIGWRSHPQRAAEPPPRVVRLRTVVIDEHPPVAPIAEERAAQLPHVGGRHHPARRLQVELAEL